VSHLTDPGLAVGRPVASPRLVRFHFHPAT